jgi:hypothetical protein
MPRRFMEGPKLSSIAVATSRFNEEDPQGAPIPRLLCQASNHPARMLDGTAGFYTGGIELVSCE